MEKLLGHLRVAASILIAGVVLASGQLHAQVGLSLGLENAATLQLMPPEKLPRYGTFWSLQHSSMAPLPYNPFPDLPVYYLGRGNSFLLDDSSVDYAAIGQQREMDRALRRVEWEQGLLSDAEYLTAEGGPTGPMGYSYGPEDLWLEIRGVTNHYAYLTLHGTVDTNYYQLLSKTNLAQPGEWALGEIKPGDSGTNQTEFPSVDIGANTNMFFRAHSAPAYLTIASGDNAYEPSLVLPFGHDGLFYINSSPSSEDLTIYYLISGTASKGVDYTNLTGVVTLSTNANSAIVYIHPIADNLIEGSETVTLTLLQTNRYLIHPDYQSATIRINDLSTHLQLNSSTEAIEPDGPPGASAVTGAFEFYRSDDLGNLPPLTVLYSLSGTAGNGVDYTNMVGVLTLGQGDQYPKVWISPLPDTLIEGLESVTLTLLPTNTLVIEPGYESNTLSIADSSTTVEVRAINDAIEPNPSSNTPKQVGKFEISRNDDWGLQPELIVSYQLSGTASNGVDYTNLTGTVKLPAGGPLATVFIEPIEDDQLEGDETVTLTLTHVSDGYRINPEFASRTLTIYDNLGTNTFQPVVSGLGFPVGIDYHEPTESLVVSRGQPASFVRIYTNTISSNLVSVVTNWSDVSNLPIEVKLCTVKTTSNGFTKGDMYFSSATGIGWLSADGTRSNLNWCILTNVTEPNGLPVGGSLAMDATGVFSNQLIVVTSPADRPDDKKGVWRVDASGQPTLLTNFTTKHLEGVISLPDDAGRWGPWAGKIVTGDENQGDIYAIDANGVLSVYDSTKLFPGSIRTEDFDVIPPNRDLYACDAERGIIVRVSQDYFTNYVGDLLITDAGEFGAPFGQLFIVHWDIPTTNFITRRIPFRYPDNAVGHFEHVTFAPIELPALTP